MGTTDFDLKYNIWFKSLFGILLIGFYSLFCNKNILPNWENKNKIIFLDVA